MTVSFKKLGKGASGGNYYLKAASVDDYYLNAGGDEPPGTWYDPTGSAPVALDGQEVEAAAFQALMAGINPQTGEALVRGAGDGHVAGFDFTFSAPKGVSVLWSQLGPEDRARIEDAQQRAVEAALGWMGENVWIARSGAGGAVKEKVPLIAAVWPHGSSRENDPQLHSHATILNVARCADGVYRTIDPQQALVYQAAIAGLYHARLAHELRQIGLEVERTADDYVFDVAGVSEAVKAHFSARSDQIDAALEDRGLDPESASKAQRDLASVDSRSEKSELTRAELNEQWSVRGAAQGFGRAEAAALLAGRTPAPPPMTDADADRIIDAVALRLTEQQSLFTHARLLAGSMVLAQDFADPANALPHIDAAIERRLVALGANEAGIEAYTTDEMIELERVMLDRANARDESLVLSSTAIDDALAEKLTMSDEQRAAVRYVCEAETRVSVIEGAPGAGKSFALDAVRDAHVREGWTVHGLALSWSAAGVLREEAKAEHARAIEGFLRAAENGTLTLDAKSLLMVDEAGLIGVRQMSRLVAVAERVGAKMILSGDTRQLKPVEAGGAMKAIVLTQTENRIDTIRRQRDHIAWQRGAINAMGRGEAYKVIGAYHQAGALRLVDTHKDALQAVIERWSASAERYGVDQTVLIAQTNADVRTLNARIHAMRVERGEIGDAVKILASDSLSRFDVEFSVGDRVQFRAGSPAISTTGTEDRVENRTVGTIRSITPAADGSFHFVIGLARGGEARFNSAQFQNRDGGMPLVHGYASTVHSAQGLTVDSVIALAGEQIKRDDAYVLMSRHRDNVEVIASRAEVYDSMRKRWGSDEFRPRNAIDDGEYAQHIGALWSRANDKMSVLEFTREAASGFATAKGERAERFKHANPGQREQQEAARREAFESRKREMAEIRSTARSVHLPTYLRDRGFDVRPNGRREYKLTTREGTTLLFPGRDGNWMAHTEGHKAEDSIGLVQRLDRLNDWREAARQLAGHPSALPAASAPARPEAVRPKADRPTLRVPSTAGVNSAKAYILERGISPPMMAEALNQRFLRLTDRGPAFCGYDQAGTLRSAEVRLRPDVIAKLAEQPRKEGQKDGPPPSKLSAEGSDKIFAPVLRGEPKHVAIVEGGFDALARWELGQKAGSERPTVIVTGGARTRKWLDQPELADLVRNASTVELWRDREARPEVQRDTDAAHDAQRVAIVSVRGKAEGVVDRLPPDGVKDLAAWNRGRHQPVAEPTPAPAPAPTRDPDERRGLRR